MTKWIGDRISIEDEQNKTTIVIAPKRVFWKEFLFTLWVIGFTFVGVVMFYLLLSDFASLNRIDPLTNEDLDNQIIYAVIFLGFWAYFEYKTLKALLWYRFGKELIRIDPDGFTLKKSILSYGKANRFFFENMKKMHIRKEESTSFGQFFENAYWALGTDKLVFEHQGKNKSFGRRLTDDMGNRLLRVIDDRVKKRIKKRN